MMESESIALPLGYGAVTLLIILFKSKFVNTFYDNLKTWTSQASCVLNTFVNIYPSRDNNNIPNYLEKVKHFYEKNYDFCDFILIFPQIYTKLTMITERTSSMKGE